MDDKSTTDENTQETDSTSTDQQTDTSVDNLDTSNQNDDKSTEDDKSTDGESSTDSPAKLDDDLDDWISKRGLKAETDEEKQALQDLRNSQREFTKSQQSKKSTQDAKALNDGLKAERDKLKTDDDDDTDDELEKTVKELKADRDQERTIRLQSEFYSENGVTAEQHKLITDVLKEKVARPATVDGKLAALDYWGSPEALPDLLDIANARLAKGTDNAALTEAAQKAERERIAKESNATSTSRGAKTTTTTDKTPEQQRLERFSTW